MARLTDDQLLAMKPGEGSYALQDAADAARRRAQTPATQITAADIDAIAARCAAEKRAKFDALVESINAAETEEQMRRIARAALFKSYPQYREDAA